MGATAVRVGAQVPSSRGPVRVSAGWVAATEVPAQEKHLEDTNVLCVHQRQSRQVCASPCNQDVKTEHEAGNYRLPWRFVAVLVFS